MDSTILLCERETLLGMDASVTLSSQIVDLDLVSKNTFFFLKTSRGRIAHFEVEFKGQTDASRPWDGGESNGSGCDAVFRFRPGATNLILHGVGEKKHCLKNRS